MWISYHTGRKVQHHNTFHAEMCQWTKWTHSIRCLLKEWFYTWSSRDRYIISHFVLCSYVLWKSCASHFLHGLSHTLTQCLEETFDWVYLNLDNVFIATIILRKNSLQHLTARHLDEMVSISFILRIAFSFPSQEICLCFWNRNCCLRLKSAMLTAKTCVQPHHWSDFQVVHCFVWLKTFGWPSGSQLLLNYDWSHAKLYLHQIRQFTTKKR